MDVDKEFALKLKLFTILEIVIFELFLLVGLSWPSYLRITAFDIRLLLLLFRHYTYNKVRFGALIILLREDQKWMFISVMLFDQD